MKTLLLYALFFVALVPVALAQSITSFSPADGTENVPLNTTVSITFDTPIPASVEPEDVGFIMEPVTIIFPEEAFDVADVAISTDRLTVTLTVNLTADTDYHFAFLGLPGDGVAIPLTQAFTATFTTGTFSGSHSISGTIDYAMAEFDFDDDWDDSDWDESTARKQRNKSSYDLSTLQRIASLGKTIPNRSSISDLPDDEDLRRRTIVLITDRPVPFFDDDDDDYWDDSTIADDENEPVVYAITTVNAMTGSYSAGRLNDGEYYVTAIFLGDEFLTSDDDDDPRGLVGFGFYTDDDDEPLAVNVSGASITDIDFTVFVFNLNFFDFSETTAFEIYSDVTQEVSHLYPDAQLYVIQGTAYWEGSAFSGPFTPDGKATSWLYRFLDKTEETEVVALRILDEIFVIPTGSMTTFDFAPLPNLADTTMIDSDQAVMIALQNGATDLIADNTRGMLSEWEISYRLSRDTAYALDFDVAIDTANPFWLIEFQYFAFDDDDEDIASVTGFYAIDAFTGVFLQEVIVTSIDDGETTSLPTAVSLMQNYPNPFNPTTSIAFTLPSHSDVRLSVYDITGREIMVMVNGSMPAGSHTVPFKAAGSLASGVYVYRLQAGGETITKKMTLLK
ncbi:MAG: T9SS type A sorting domain-containing protein [Bacteroidetes bacterium]|nr:T9SS type A sorting domain-containing protein [Bacteroidota bacterium]